MLQQHWDTEAAQCRVTSHKKKGRTKERATKRQKMNPVDGNTGNYNGEVGEEEEGGGVSELYTIAAT